MTHFELQGYLAEHCNRIELLGRRGHWQHQRQWTAAFLSGNSTPTRGQVPWEYLQGSTGARAEQAFLECPDTEFVAEFYPHDNRVAFEIEVALEQRATLISLFNTTAECLDWCLTARDYSFTYAGTHEGYLYFATAIVP